MNPQKSLLFASLLPLFFAFGCQVPVDHTACNQQLEKAQADMQSRLDSIGASLFETKNQILMLENELAQLRDSVHEQRNSAPKILEQTPKGKGIKLDGQKPGERPMGRK